MTRMNRGVLLLDTITVTVFFFPAQPSFDLGLALDSFARPMAFYVLFALLALCTGQTVSPTTSPSPSPTPCSAPPGYFCIGGSALICPIGAYCAGGSAQNVSCYPVTACSVVGLSVQPPCYWNVSTLAGSGTAAYSDGFGTNAGFNSLEHVAADISTGIVYIADSGNNRIRAAFPNGTVYTYAPSTIFGGPQGVATLNGVVYIADTNSNTIRQGVTKLAGGGASGTASGQIDGLGTNALFALPDSLTVGPSGIIYVTDYFNSKIRAVSTGGVVTTVAGGGVSGSQAGYVDAIGTSAYFRNPAGITCTLTLLVIGDSYNHCVRLVYLSNNSVTTVAGTGVSGSSDGYGASASFNIPVGVVVVFGVIYVSDLGNNKIRRIDTSGFVSTLAGGAGWILECLGTASDFSLALWVNR